MIDLESITSAAEEALYESTNRGDRPGSDARRYLNGHGITSYEIVRNYRLGLHEGRLAFPYITPAGVKAIKLRCIADHDCGAIPLHGKYLPVFEGQKVHLYNVRALREAGDTIGIAEGETNAIVATEALGIPTVGAPLTGWKASLFWMKNLEDFTRVIIWKDGDEGGKKFVDGLKPHLPVPLDVAECPPGHDVATMVAAGRAAELADTVGVSVIVNSHRSSTMVP